MRIRSIKYKSSTSNLIDQPNHHSSHFESRPRITNSNSTDSQPNVNIKAQKHQEKILFTEHFFNVKPQESSQRNHDIKNNFLIIMNGGVNRAGIRSQKIASKASSMHNDVKTNENKENRTSIFQKNKLQINGLQSLSVHNQKSGMRDKIRFRLSKFSHQGSETPDILNSKNQSISIVNDEICQKDQIILGENLTYNMSCLQSQLQQIRLQTRKQHNKIEKIRKDLGILGPKIERQLQRITQQFRKGLGSLESSMSRAKTEKCTQLVNWKNVIKQKTKEYQEERDMMGEIDEHVERVKGSLEGRELGCILMEIGDIGDYCTEENDSQVIGWE